jgi:pSer/pThr/pTyr-binding forkhead associated (FHA) protein
MSFSYSIGRSSLNDIRLTDKSISSIHAKIFLGKDGFMWIEDLDSKNGTYINGFKVNGKSKIKPGDRLSLGAYEFDWMSQILSRQPEEKANVPIAALNENNVKSTAIKKNYFMQYTIVAILAISILSTVLLGSNLSNWNKTEPGKEKTTQNGEGDDVSDKVENDKTENKNGTNESGSDSDKEDKGTSQKNPKRTTSHDLSCLSNEDFISQGIKIGNDFEDIFMQTADVEVSLEEERKVGEQTKKNILSKSSLLNDSKYTNRIDRIMKRLLDNLDNPKFNYEWYVVNQDIINAQTCGGFIFIYKGIIDFADDDDELAAILAHEIYHNELGHIAEHIKKEKIAKGIFGEFSQIPLIAATIVTMPNNQYNEANCDLFGIDLAERAGYDGCHAEKLWQRMKQKEGNRMEFEKLFSTHPFSKDRANCINKHMKNNYNRTCSH